LLHEIIATLFRERGLDRRTSYTNVTALPPDGATVEVDCSDASVADELRRRFAARDDAKHVRVELLPRSDQPERMLVASAIGDVRREPSHRSELVNQVIHGDGVTPLKREANGCWRASTTVTSVGFETGI
jgi:hypothetical protein